MKVNGPGGIGQASGPRATRTGGGEGFRLPTIGGPASAGQVASTSATHGVMGVEALLALQDVGTPTERKRRAVSRAGRILDVLDEIKVALLDGDLNPTSLNRLRRAVRDERAQTDDAELEAVLDDIELRAAVEAAKLESATRAA